MRPRFIVIRLMADGVQVERRVVTENSGWTWTFEDMERFGEDGHEIVYTITEDEVEGYTSEIDGYNALNVRTPDVKTLSVVKYWDDADNMDHSRPDSVRMRLTADGVTIRTVMLNDINHWYAEVRDLPVKTEGREIIYNWEEQVPEGYTVTATVQDNMTRVTNHHTPELTSVSVRKIWNDNDNAEGIRPDNITMVLSNGMSVTLNAANGWQATISGLPAKINGIPVMYTWHEHEVTGYTQTKAVTADNVTVITNTLWKQPEVPEGQKPPKTPGVPVYVFEEYDTPLGVEVMINHVGDCFD